MSPVKNNYMLTHFLVRKKVGGLNQGRSGYSKHTLFLHRAFILYIHWYICSGRVNSDYTILATLNHHKQVRFFKTQCKTKSMNLHFDSKLLYIHISVSSIKAQLLVFCCDIIPYEKNRGAQWAMERAAQGCT